MVEGPHDTEPDDVAPEDGRILSPEELDISDNEYVTEIEDGRFVVSPDEPRTERPPPATGADQSRPQQPPASRQERVEPVTQPQGPPRQAAAESTLTEEMVHGWLRQSFADASSRYGFDVTATFDGSVSQRRIASNDVVTIFESLILWYAQQIDGDTPVEEILGILLMESNVPVRYPPESVRILMESKGLEPDDSIADLLEAVEKRDGLEI